MSTRILIANNDPRQQESLQTLLPNNRYGAKSSVDSVSTRAGALEIMRQRTYGLVICAVALPDGDAMEVLRDTRTYSAAEFVVSGRNWDDERYVELVANGAYGPICPPFTDHPIYQQHTIDVLKAAGNGKEERVKKMNDHADFLRHYDVVTQKRLVALMALTSQDHEKREHVVAVGNNTRRLGKLMGADDNQANRWRVAAEMHDLGKRMVDPAVTMKPGKLEPDERATMQRHVIHGRHIVEAVEGRLGGSAQDFIADARAATAEHHEKWDGSGYPAKLSGKDISGLGTVVAVADSFDAITRKRTYQPGKPVAVARELIIKDSGTHFRPEVVEAFQEMIEG